MTGTVLAVSDGSYQQDHGACTWITEGSTSTDQIMGHMIAPGTSGSHSSFKRDVAGMYGLLLMLWHFLERNTEPIAYS